MSADNQVAVVSDGVAPHHHSVDSLSVTTEALSQVPSDVIIKSRIKYGSRWSACKGVLMEYSKFTTIHGIRYIFEVHRPLYEKFYWFVLTVISFYFAISLIWATFLKWQDSPVILGFDETLVPVHKIPFPTITICPETKMEKNLFDFTNVSQRILDEIGESKTFENTENFTEEELQFFAAALHICETDVVNLFAPLLMSKTNPNIAQILIDLTNSKNETGPFCQWHGRYYFCEKIFSFVTTDEGICYQFNGLHAKDIYRDPRYLSYYDEEEIDFNNIFGQKSNTLNKTTGNWSLDEGFQHQGYNSYPQRTTFASSRKGFFAFLQSFSHNFDYACRSSKQGYKVFLNSPESVPLTTGNYILVPHTAEVLVSVLPHYIMASKNLHDFVPEKRQCYFNDERYLRYFRYYSQNNCQTECLANYTIAKCGCVKFWMPKPFDVRVCNLSDINCYTTAQTELNLALQNQTMQKRIDSNTKIMCDCMPACTSLDYNFEISSAEYDLAKTFAALREVYEHNDFMASRLSVYFKQTQFTAIKRTALYGIPTLLANCGGILGLFLGFSSLSIIELLYFFSMRLFINLRQRRIIKKKLLKQQLGHEN